MKVFSGSANKPLAENIAKDLHTQLSPLEISIFPDGERRVRVEEDVVEVDAVIIQPTATPGDQNYMELFFIADAVNRSGARSVTAVVPYLGYQRQDHVFRIGEAVSLEVIVKTLQSVGIDRIIAFDFHSVKITEDFQIPVSHLSALSLFAEVIKKNQWNMPDNVLVSPDMGGIRRIKELAEILNMPYTTIEKDRDLATGKVKAVKVNGEVGRRAIIVDDMVASGNTLIKAAQLLIEEGVEEVVAFATHGVLSNEASEMLERSQIAAVYLTDSVLIPEEKKFSKLVVLSISEIIAKELHRLISNI